ncbi:MAG: zinc ribbon domain-containing protein [Candidatus Methanosuratincola sp.]
MKTDTITLQKHAWSVTLKSVFQGTTAKLTIALFVVSIMFVSALTISMNYQLSTYINAQAALPAAVIAVLNGFIHSFVWHFALDGLAVIFILSLLFFATVEGIGQLVRISSEHLVAALRINPKLVEADKFTEKQFEGLFNLKGLFIIYVVLAIVVGFALYFLKDSPNVPYLFLVLAIIMGAALLFWALRINISIVKRHTGIKKAELARYEAYSMVQLIIIGFFTILCVLIILGLVKFVSEAVSNVIWTDFYESWRRQMEQLYHEYPSTFQVPYEIISQDIGKLAEGMKAHAMIESMLPDPIPQFSVILGLLILVVFGIVLNLTVTNYFYGIRKTCISVLVPIGFGVIFYLAALVFPLQKQGILIASIIYIGANYLFRTLATNLLRTPLGVLCPNPDCQSVNDSTASFCSDCGAKLNEGEVRIKETRNN